jgi:ATP-dependent Clp protease protease subunit
MKDIGEEFKRYATGHHGIGSHGLDSYMQASGMNQPVSSYITPTILEERPMNVTQMDVFSRLMMDRILFLGVPINDDVANIIQAQLLFLESLDNSRDIQMYINCPGGSVYGGLGIYDTMQYVSPNVATICTSIAASMGAILLCAGQARKRAILPHARVMIHQPLGGIGGQASDIEITANEIVKIKEELYTIISEHSGQAYDRVYSDADRDFWMNAEEARDYGMVDEVLSRHEMATK